ncbi:MAG: hypothetical protein ACE5GK_06080 [Nitrospiria bacterium]
MSVRYFHFSKQRFSISALLLVWFFVWGVCPWDNASVAAQALGGAHARHGHREMDDTHHASKGGEHSCTMSASLSKEESTGRTDNLKPLPQNDFPLSVAVPYRFEPPDPLPLGRLRAHAFLKPFSSLYQRNQSLRL